MTLNIDQKILDKLRKLYELASHPNTPEEEADVALRMIEAIKVRHNIAVAVDKISGTETVEEKYGRNKSNLKRTRHHPAQEYITKLLRDYFNVYVQYINYYENGLKYMGIELVGTQQDVEIARFLQNTLIMEFQRRWERFNKEQKVSHEGRGSYYQGLGEGLWEQLKEERERAKEEVMEEVKNSKGQEFALMVLDQLTISEEAKKKKLDEAIYHFHPHLRPKTPEELEESRKRWEIYRNSEAYKKLHYRKDGKPRTFRYSRPRYKVDHPFNQEVYDKAHKEGKSMSIPKPLEKGTPQTKLS